jgi:flavin reductase (DIM6/NTAB) family NADH-FMN oxidoreductase RutF
MNLTCAPAPPEIDEFDVAGVTRAPGRLVAAPMVLESPVNFECRLTEIVRLRDAGGRELDAWLVLGEVVAVHIDRTLIVDGLYHTVAAQPLGRLGRLGDYVEVSGDAVFEMRRPGWPIA